MLHLRYSVAPLTSYIPRLKSLLQSDSYHYQSDSYHYGEPILAMGRSSAGGLSKANLSRTETTTDWFILLLDCLFCGDVLLLAYMRNEYLFAICHPSQNADSPFLPLERRCNRDQPITTMLLGGPLGLS